MTSTRIAILVTALLSCGCQLMQREMWIIDEEEEPRSASEPIADVTVRYKDLVYLRNSVARANLTLGRDTDPPGPLERNVVIE